MTLSARYIAGGTSYPLHCFHPLISPCGSRCGSKLLHLIKECRQNIKYVSFQKRTAVIKELERISLTRQMRSTRLSLTWMPQSWRRSSLSRRYPLSGLSSWSCSSFSANRSFSAARWLTIPKFSFQHCFYHQLLEFWCVFLVWHSFWHNKTPHLLGSISYCLTCGVQFRSNGSFSNLQISYSVRTRLSNFGTRMRMVTLSSTTSLICASQVALIKR